jgi:anti-sigma regulatory factor (Ser/Thr protein kinase)
VKPEQPNGRRNADPVHIHEAGGDVGESVVTSREFRPEDTAPSAARRFTEHALRCWGHDGSVIDDARLLVSELVTNAVNHTRSPFSVSVAAHSPKVRVAVHDRSSTIPVKGGPSTGAPSGGRGLQIVADLADDWGVVRTPVGKTVWAELSARAA